MGAHAVKDLTARQQRVLEKEEESDLGNDLDPGRATSSPIPSYFHKGPRATGKMTEAATGQRQHRPAAATPVLPTDFVGRCAYPTCAFQFRKTHTWGQR